LRALATWKFSTLKAANAGPISNLTCLPPSCILYPEKITRRKFRGGCKSKHRDAYDGHLLWCYADCGDPGGACSRQSVKTGAFQMVQGPIAYSFLKQTIRFAYNFGRTKFNGLLPIRDGSGSASFECLLIGKPMGLDAPELRDMYFGKLRKAGCIKGPKKNDDPALDSQGGTKTCAEIKRSGPSVRGGALTGATVIWKKTLRTF